MSTCPIVCAPNTWLSQLGSTWRPIHMNRDIPFSVSNKCPLNNKQTFAGIVRDILFIYPRLAKVFLLPALGTGFSRASCFPAIGTESYALGTGFMFSRARHRILRAWHGFMFSRARHRILRAWHGFMFSRARHRILRAWHGFMFSRARHRILRAWHGFMFSHAWYKIGAWRT